MPDKPIFEVEKKKKNRELLYKALVDLDFRKLLSEDPESALGVKELTPENKREIALVLAHIKGIENQIALVADELLCANGGPCGIG